MVMRGLAARGTRDRQLANLHVRKIDRPRRIDQVIDYFGIAPVPVAVSMPGRSLTRAFARGGSGGTRGRD